MVLVMILAIVAAGMLWLSFGRHVLLSRANASESNQQLAAGVQSQVLACLDLNATTYGTSDCTVPNACLVTSIAGVNVTVSSVGSAPNCQLTFTVSD